MNIELVSALISFSVAIVSTVLTLIISNSLNKLQVQSKFIKQLYTKKLETYMEIFELVSGFIKIIKRKGISYDGLKDFYDKYSLLDSKLGLLFSHTINFSDSLMSEIKEKLDKLKPEDNTDDLKADMIKRLSYIELSMKLELGIFKYTDPLKIIKKVILPEEYREALAKMAKDKAEVKKIKKIKMIG